MYTYTVPSARVAISDPVHRAINDLVAKMTDNKMSGWLNNYEIIISLDGGIKAWPSVGPNPHGLLGFSSGLEQKLVCLPTPSFVINSRQEIFICFAYEVEEIMGEWWKRFAANLG